MMMMLLLRPYVPPGTVRLKSSQSSQEAVDRPRRVCRRQLQGRTSYRNGYLGNWILTLSQQGRLHQVISGPLTQNVFIYLLKAYPSTAQGHLNTTTRWSCHIYIYTIHLITSQSLFTVPDISQSKSEDVFGENEVEWTGKAEIDRLQALAAAGKACYARLYSYSRLEKWEPFLALVSHPGGGLISVSAQYRTAGFIKILDVLRPVFFSKR